VLFAFAYLALRRLLRLVTGCCTDLDKDIELVVLRHQLKVLNRQVGKPRLQPRDRLFLVAMSGVLPRRLWSSFVISPQMLLRWHRELVRKKWTYRRRSAGGRPPITKEVRELIVRMGTENPRWGCIRIRGELGKLGIRVSATKIRTLLRGSGLGPAPRGSGPTWSEFLRSQARGILALDFFTAETLWLRTLFVLFAIEVGSRRVRVLGVTRNPDSAWVTQQARNLTVDGWLKGIRFVIRDRDSKFSGPFDEVFRSEGVRIIRTPIRPPRRTASPSGGFRTVRTECLDWMLLFGRRHLERVLRAFVAHYNEARPHRGLELKPPSASDRPLPRPADVAHVRRRDVLGGLIHDYEVAA
jgi:putative transposase